MHPTVQFDAGLAVTTGVAIKSDAQHLLAPPCLREQAVQGSRHPIIASSPLSPIAASITYQSTGQP
ncbi:hypothetical protein TSOC_007875 [Tetrabaena socialis]|uniref:Uncharacterized protein n=1 Tax=Tetrabaena socialis TaxID=47790 RepID=A0A2J8A023_9CHLO|nr:hypothetical protein TSOC_007875 [Tetrabaena socialis]|eukprot:PNH05838.1 hypothetical protein TSOC_007875 [Tetrabaena socialis]